MENSTQHTIYNVQSTTKRLSKWLHATRRRKILLLVLFVLITFTTFKIILFPPKETKAAISEVTESTTTTLDQTSYTTINSMSIADPGAGYYLAIFTMEVLLDASPGGNNLLVARDGL